MHRTLLRTALAMGLLAVMLGCGDSERSLRLRITGTEGLRFAGHYVLHTAGQESRQALDQTVPFEIDLLGTDVSCMAQKMGGDGTLRVEILVDGEAVAFDWTRDQYGHVSAVTP